MTLVAPAAAAAARKPRKLVRKSVSERARRQREEAACSEALAQASQSTPPNAGDNAGSTLPKSSRVPPLRITPISPPIPETFTRRGGIVSGDKGELIFEGEWRSAIGAVARALQPQTHARHPSGLAGTSRASAFSAAADKPVPSVPVSSALEQGPKIPPPPPPPPQQQQQQQQQQQLPALARHGTLPRLPQKPPKIVAKLSPTSLPGDAEQYFKVLPALSKERRQVPSGRFPPPPLPPTSVQQQQQRQPAPDQRVSVTGLLSSTKQAQKSAALPSPPLTPDTVFPLQGQTSLVQPIKMSEVDTAQATASEIPMPPPIDQLPLRLPTFTAIPPASATQKPIPHGKTQQESKIHDLGSALRRLLQDKRFELEGGESEASIFDADVCSEGESEHW